MQSNPITGALLGTAVGDALGLPYEALSRRRARRLFGAPDRHRFVFGHGMVSDDTEHSCLVAQALCRSGGDVERFRTRLAWGLRGWLLCLPAGLGFATLRAILKLCLGFPPRRSGVFSAGNGPAMRAAVLGAAIDDSATLAAFVSASTTMTHTDPKAYAGALAVALAARESAAQRHDGRRVIDALRALASGAATDECCNLLQQAVDSVGAGESTLQFADRLGCSNGVSGYVLHTVPVAIHAWLSFPHDFAAAVRTAIACGGDTDTVGAIVGGIAGAGCGRAGIPPLWLDRIAEWPRSVQWMQRLGAVSATALAAQRPARPPRAFAPFVFLRNLVFLTIILLHAARRALPPY